jgi:hypothetical protein
MLFCLIGLNTIHVGGSYENATLKSRRVWFPNPNAPIDILASSSDNNYLYLCQCSLGTIKDKIDEIATFANELDNIILMDYISRPKIHSLIITNVERNLLLKDNIKEAEKKQVKIVTGDDLSLLINAVRVNNIITAENI